MSDSSCVPFPATRLAAFLRRAAPAAAIACLLAATVAAHAEGETAPAPDAGVAGNVLALAPLRDQHGGISQLGPTTALLLLTRDMDGGSIAKEALADGGHQALTAARAVYVADVSRMPAFIRSAFALPAMRRRPYPVVLDETGRVTAALPYRQGQVSVIRLDDHRITGVSFASSSAEVRAALQQ